MTHKPVCIECGRHSHQQLFKKYTGGAIQLLQCESCHKLIDKYVEYDAVILLLDVLLLRIQSYRHFLFNYDITNSLLWRLTLVFVLCEAYTKLKRLGLDTSNPIVLQVCFHSFFARAIIEAVVSYLVSFLLIVVFSSPPSSKHAYRLTLRVLVLSDYGKLSALAAMIWSEDFYLWLPLALVALSQFQAMNAILKQASFFKACLMVLVVNLAVHGGGYLLEGPRTAMVQHMLGDLLEERYH